MAILLLVFVLIIVYAIYQNQQKSNESVKTQSLATALKAEIENEFPEYAAKISDGATSLIAIEILKDGGNFEKMMKVYKKLERRSDWPKLGNLEMEDLLQQPGSTGWKEKFAGISEKTLDIGLEYAVAYSKYIMWFQENMPKPLREHLNVSNVSEITARAIARVAAAHAR